MFYKFVITLTQDLSNRYFRIPLQDISTCRKLHFMHCISCFVVITLSPNCVSYFPLPTHRQSLIIPGKSPTRKKSGPFSSRRSSAIGIENIQEVQERR